MCDVFIYPSPNCNGCLGSRLGMNAWLHHTEPEIIIFQIIYAIIFDKLHRALCFGKLAQLTKTTYIFVKAKEMG